MDCCGYLFFEYVKLKAYFVILDSNRLFTISLRFMNEFFFLAFFYIAVDFLY